MYGDTAALRRRATQLRHEAQTLRDRATALHTQAENAEWKSKAATAVRATATTLTAELGSRAGLLDQVAADLDAHAAAVDQRKAEIAAAERYIAGLIGRAQSIANTAQHIVTDVATHAIDGFMNVITWGHGGDPGRAQVSYYVAEGRRVAASTVLDARRLLGLVAQPASGSIDWLSVQDTVRRNGLG